MKKHLFLIASVFTAFSLQAQSVPTVKVAANTTVKVKPSTLFYVNGSMSVDPYTQADKKISNEGHVKITQKLETGYKDNSSTASFVNEFAGVGKYGQLIVTGSEANKGKIKSIVKLNSNFVYHSLAIPYEGVNALDLIKQLYPGKTEDEITKSFVGYKYENAAKKYFDKNRKKNPLFTWDNSNYYLRHLTKTEEIEPTAYYAVNKGSALGAFDVVNVSSIEGQPAKKEYTVTLKEYQVGKSLESNPVGEYYGSYIFDYTKKMPEGWTDYKKKKPGVSAGTFGSNIFDLANPYTSNIDLSKLSDGAFLSKVETLVQYTSESYNEAVNSGGASDAYGVSNFSAFVPGQGTGDEPLGFVRPFQTFSVKMKNGFGSAVLTFNDNVKTFEVNENTPNTLYNRGLGSTSEINQVGLDIVNPNGVLVGKTYVVASDIYEAARKGKGVEVYNIALDDNTIGIYTLQENEDGTVNEDLSKSKSYINGVNADKYIAKPIHMVFQNGKGEYTLKARLNESLENNKNAFYFEDKLTGKVQKVTKGFEYTFNVNGTEKDRFVLYWAATPNQEKIEEVAKQEVNTTTVFKDVDTYKVRFDKGIKKADVFVYNISGQLINSVKSVDTSVDYVVPLKGNIGVYIVKVVGDNGKIITKKIIK